jgi:Rne/Rng family ribonuclease
MVKRKIVVSERDNIATVFEDERAVEFIINRGSMLLGDVYLATVENILPSIDAAFVNVGSDKMGFLHSSDVNMGKGDLRNRLQPKQQVLVQIMKEPTGHKGPRVTTNISLPGRFLVLMPESKGISISRKIEQASERSRLKTLVSSLKPPGVGIIIRTEADQQKESDIQEDLETLLERWQNIVSMSDSSQCPALLYRDQDLLYRVIREAVSDDVREIWVDTPFGASRAQQLLSNWNLDKNIKVQQYTGQQSIMVGMGVEREIKLAVQTKVPMQSGGYLYIQPTEALTVIDVNSGKFTSLQSQAETIRLTNLEAVKEIARQLRLRNIGGMIIVDFIDMETRADKLEMMQALEDALAPDKAKPQIGQLSDLGLVELTRHRQGQALSEIFTRRCIACNGSGHAVEDFSWATPAGETARFRPGFNRQGFQPNSPQQRKPFGHPQHQQQGNRRPGGPANQAVPSANQNLAIKPMLQQITVALTERPVDTTPLIFKTKADLAAAEAATPTPSKVELPLDELLKQRFVQRMGLRLSSVVHAGITPPESNNSLARLNPKSNNVLTLIRMVQTTGGAMGGEAMMDDMDDDDVETYGNEGGSPTGEAQPPYRGGRVDMQPHEQRHTRERYRQPAEGDMDTGADDDEDDDDTLTSPLMQEDMPSGGSAYAPHRSSERSMRPPTVPRTFGAEEEDNNALSAQPALLGANGQRRRGRPPKPSTLLQPPRAPQRSLPFNAAESIDDMDDDDASMALPSETALFMPNGLQNYVFADEDDDALPQDVERMGSEDSATKRISAVPTTKRRRGRPPKNRPTPPSPLV